LVYSTYLGGSAANDTSSGAGIALDGAGNAYVTGSTTATDFPTTAGALQVSKRGPAIGQNVAPTPNAFVAKLNAGGTGFIYSTYLGGRGGDTYRINSGDSGAAIAVDAADTAHVKGRTCSNGFHTLQAVRSTLSDDESVT